MRKNFIFNMFLRFILLVNIILVTSQTSVEIFENGSDLDVFSTCFNPHAFPNDLILSNVVGEATLSNILRHTRILLTDGTSTKLVRQIFTNIREVLTNETARKNIQNIIEYVDFVLRDDHSSVVVQNLCKLAEAVEADHESSKKILRSVITLIMKVLSHENTQPALQGLAEGLRKYFSQLTSEKVNLGLRRLNKYRETNNKRK